MERSQFFRQLGPEIEDPEEETFLLFSQPFPSQDLGIIDTKASCLELCIADRDLTITQSPGILSSDRKDGTTGAVVWKVTPSFAEWLAKDNILFKSGVLHLESTVLELGCGISGIVPSTLAPRVSRYIATDQTYVFKFLKHNLKENAAIYGKPSRSRASANVEPRSNIDVLALDWETSSAASLSSHLLSGEGIDLVIACDCVYNEALILPFVNTCVEICQLHRSDHAAEDQSTICVVAQQLRSDSVFVAWLSAFSEAFHVWRLPDEDCSDRLRPENGFVVHLGILKPEAEGKKESRVV